MSDYMAHMELQQDREPKKRFIFIRGNLGYTDSSKFETQTFTEPDFFRNRLFQKYVNLTDEQTARVTAWLRTSPHVDDIIDVNSFIRIVRVL